MAFKVTVRGTHRKGDYIKGYAITGSDGKDRDIWFGRGFSGERPICERGEELLVDLEQGKWIVGLSVPANGGRQQQQQPASPQLPEAVRTKLADMGAKPVAAEQADEAAPRRAEGGITPRDVERIAAGIIRVIFPQITKEDCAALLEQVRRAVQEYDSGAA